MGAGYTIPEYIDRKTGCKLIGVAPSTMSKHFKKIRELYPNSIKIKGKVNKRDFYHYFNLENYYRRKQNDK